MERLRIDDAFTVSGKLYYFVDMSVKSNRERIKEFYNDSMKYPIEFYHTMIDMADVMIVYISGGVIKSYILLRCNFVTAYSCDNDTLIWVKDVIFHMNYDKLVVNAAYSHNQLCYLGFKPHNNGLFVMVK